MVDIVKGKNKQIEIFHNANQLNVGEVDFSFTLCDDIGLTAVACLKENIIQGVCVRSDCNGSNLLNTLISQIFSYCAGLGIYDLMLFTKPSLIKQFNSLDFQLVVKSDNVAFMEHSIKGISSAISKLKGSVSNLSSDVGCIVINGNPFTNGHLYLVEYASKRHKNVIVFIVQEDKSEFSFSQRLEMAKLATKHLSNVSVLPSSKYIVSRYTFPSYFLKESQVDIDSEYALIDALVFKTYFVPEFNIKCRYLGSEPNCLVTSMYNSVLKQTLDCVEIIPRKQVNGEVVSASFVRKLINEGKLEQIKNLVPPSTLECIDVK